MFFFLMIRRPPRSTLSSSSAASDVYKRQILSSPGKTKPQVPGEHEGEPLIQSVYVVFPAPDEVGKLLLCLNGIQGVHNVITELDKLGQIQPWGRAFRRRGIA